MKKFQELINAETPVLVDFFAEWCAPCKTMAPVLKDVVSTIGDKAKIIKVDIDKNPQVATTYGIQGVPTFILFKKGKIEWRQSGVVANHELVRVINQFS